MNYFTADDSCHYMKFLSNNHEAFFLGRSLKIYDYHTKEKLAYFSGKYVATKAIQLDNSILIIGHYGEMDLYDFTKGIGMEHNHSQINKISCLYNDKYNKKLIVGTYSGKVIISDYFGNDSLTVDTKTSMIKKIEYNPKLKEYYLLGMHDKTIEVYDINWNYQKKLKFDKTDNLSIDIAGEKIALLMDEGVQKIEIYDTKNWDLLSEIPIKGLFKRFNWHPASNFLILEDYDKSYIIDIDNSVINEMEGTHVEFSHNGVTVSYLRGNKIYIDNFFTALDIDPPLKAVNLNFIEGERSSKQDLSIDNIPKDLNEFLSTGQQLDFDPDNCETGKLALKTINELEIEYISFYNDEIDIEEEEYDTWDDFHYVKGISLTSSCECYEPEFILCYLPEYETYATYDNEHNQLWIFPETDWRDIVDNPLVYIETQWDCDSEYAVKIHTNRDIESR